MTATKQAGVMATIDSLLRELAGPSGVKMAEAKTEAGGFEGPTEHPSKKVDDSTEDAYEGSRTEENDKDVAEAEGPNEVDGEPKQGRAKKALAETQDDVQLNIGTTQKATGESPDTETDSAKGGKEDGGTYEGSSSHPARTDNESLDGSKYSAATKSLRLAIKAATDAGHEALAAIIVDADQETRKQAEALAGGKLPAKATGKSAGATPTKAAGQKHAEACETCGQDPCGCEKMAAAEKAGSDLAKALLSTLPPGMDKQALDAQVVQDLGDTIISAYRMADKVAEVVLGFREGQRKRAAEEAAAENPPREGESSGEAPPEDAGAEGAAPGGTEQDLLAQLLAGGEGMPPAGLDAAAGGGMGGAPGGMGSAPGGMDGGLGLGGGLGGPPAGGPGGAPGGAPDEQQLQMLAAVLDELQQTPESLEQAATAKAAAALKRHQANGAPRSSTWKPKTARDAQQYQGMLNYIREVVSAS